MAIQIRLFRRGDWGKLARLQSELKALASGSSAMARLSNVLGAAAMTELQRGFRGSRDPYGEPWAPIKGSPKASGGRKRGAGGRFLKTKKVSRVGGKPLLDTGRLRASFSYSPSSAGVRIGTTVRYASAHQYGVRSKRLPARPMVPTRARGLGMWQAPLEAATKRFFSRIFRK